MLYVDLHVCTESQSCAKNDLINMTLLINLYSGAFILFLNFAELLPSSIWISWTKNRQFGKHQQHDGWKLPLAAQMNAPSALCFYVKEKCLTSQYSFLFLRANEDELWSIQIWFRAGDAIKSYDLYYSDGCLLCVVLWRWSMINTHTNTCKWIRFAAQ